MKTNLKRTIDGMKEVNKKEMVCHPSHYQSKGGIEVIDVIESFELGFSLGNAVKYILRCGKKDDAVQEIDKAIWYLSRHRENILKSKEKHNA